MQNLYPHQFIVYLEIVQGHLTTKSVADPLPTLALAYPPLAVQAGSDSYEPMTAKAIVAVLHRSTLDHREREKTK